MAVYKRSYRAYSGRLTPEWSRFYILTRYALANLFRSKFLTAAFVMCFFGPLVCMVGIYLNHNASVLALLHAAGSPLIGEKLDHITHFRPERMAGFVPRVIPKNRWLDPPVKVGDGFKRLSEIA